MNRNTEYDILNLKSRRSLEPGEIESIEERIREVALVHGTKMQYSKTSTDGIISYRIEYQKLTRTIQALVGWASRQTFLILSQHAESGQPLGTGTQVRNDAALDKLPLVSSRVMILEGHNLHPKKPTTPMHIGVRQDDRHLLFDSMGYSIVYDEDRIRWYEENFTGGVILHLPPEEMSLIQNMPIDHLDSYLRGLLENLDLKINVSQNLPLQKNYFHYNLPMRIKVPNTHNVV